MTTTKSWSDLSQEEEERTSVRPKKVPPSNPRTSSHLPVRNSPAITSTNGSYKISVSYPTQHSGSRGSPRHGNSDSQVPDEEEDDGSWDHDGWEQQEKSPGGRNVPARGGGRHRGGDRSNRQPHYKQPQVSHSPPHTPSQNQAHQTKGQYTKAHSPQRQTPPKERSDMNRPTQDSVTHAVRNDPPKSTKSITSAQDMTTQHQQETTTVERKSPLKPERQIYVPPRGKYSSILKTEGRVGKEKESKVQLPTEQPKEVNQPAVKQRLLILDIEVRTGEVRPLEVFEGDDPKITAQKFCQAHDMAEVFVDFIADQIQTYVERVKEQ